MTLIACSFRHALNASSYGDTVTCRAQPDLSALRLTLLNSCVLTHQTVKQPVIDHEESLAVLNEFRRLRMTDRNIYLRNGSINRINGLIGMTFSCDGAHYIDHKTSFEKLETFATSDADIQIAAVSRRKKATQDK